MPHSKSRNAAWRNDALRRKAKWQERDNYEFRDDTAHALSQPSKLTPLQLKRLARSNQRKAARIAQRAEKSRKSVAPNPVSKIENPIVNAEELKKLAQMSSSEFLRAVDNEGR